jgi:hypothetical protein
MIQLVLPVGDPAGPGLEVARHLAATGRSGRAVYRRLAPIDRFSNPAESAGHPGGSDLYSRGAVVIMTPLRQADGVGQSDHQTPEAVGLVANPRTALVLANQIRREMLRTGKHRYANL